MSTVAQSNSTQPLLFRHTVTAYDKAVSGFCLHDLLKKDYAVCPCWMLTWSLAWEQSKVHMHCDGEPEAVLLLLTLCPEPWSTSLHTWLFFPKVCPAVYSIKLSRKTFGTEEYCSLIHFVWGLYRFPIQITHAQLLNWLKGVEQKKIKKENTHPQNPGWNFSNQAAIKMCMSHLRLGPLGSMDYCSTQIFPEMSDKFTTAIKLSAICKRFTPEFS